jgi:hypothetical protein
MPPVSGHEQRVQGEEKADDPSARQLARGQREYYSAEHANAADDSQHKKQAVDAAESANRQRGW